MKPQIHTITLGVEDLEKSVSFYRDLIGWHTDGIVGAEFDDLAVAIFNMQHGSRLQLFSKTGLAKEANVQAADKNAPDFSLGYYVNSSASVDKTIEQLRQRIPTSITKEPGKTSWGGYNAYFQDLDGHLWEVVYDPKLTIEE
jgi:catechol 2,3-dioxygenase-like lactoylglutathione lyase family enzyme